MTTGMHPQAAEALRTLEQLGDLIDGQKRRATNESFTARDEAETVEVTIDGNRHLKGLRIDDSLPQLGSEEVERRINEAVRNAQAAAEDGIAEGNDQFIAGLAGLADSLQKMLGLA